jgi:hypothetical protein
VKEVKEFAAKTSNHSATKFIIVTVLPQVNAHNTTTQVPKKASTRFGSFNETSIAFISPSWW